MWKITRYLLLSGTLDVTVCMQQHCYHAGQCLSTTFSSVYEKQKDSLCELSLCMQHHLDLLLTMLSITRWTVDFTVSSVLVWLVSKKTSRYCHSTVVVASVVVGIIVQKL